jgi:HEAT repeat protein
LLSDGKELLLRLREFSSDRLDRLTTPLLAVFSQAKSGVPDVAYPASPVPRDASAEGLRNWRDATGQISVHAKLVDVADGKVILECEDGKRVELELTRLSADDQTYVANQRPEYQGKPLSHWIARAKRPEPKARFEALQALTQMAIRSEPARKVLEQAVATERSRLEGALRILEATGPHAKAAVPALARLIQDRTEDRYSRRGVVSFLGKMGAEAGEAVPALTASLRDPEGLIRAAAARALAEMGALAKPAIPVFVEMLRDPEAEVRFAATEVLRRKDLHSEEAVPELMRLLQDQDPWVQVRAAETLCRMGPETAKLATGVLIESVRDPQFRRTEACVTLIELGTETAKIGLPALVESFELMCRNGMIDPMSIQAVRNAGPEAMQAVIPMITRSLKDQDKDRRRRALWTLGSLGPAAKSALPEVKTMLEDADVSRDAFAAVWCMGTDAIPVLIETLAHADGAACAQAAHWLGLFGEHVEPWVKAFRPCLAGSTIPVYCEAEMRQLEQEVKAAIPTLLERLHDANSEVVVRAAAAIGSIDPKGSAKAAVPPIVARLRDADPFTRSELIDVLIKMRPESYSAIPILTELLDDKEPKSRCDAARALAQMGTEPKAKAMVSLIAMLRHPDKLARCAAATTMGQIGTEAAEAIPALTTLLEETDNELRRSAAVALGKMGPSAAKIAMPVLMELLVDQDSRWPDEVPCTLIAMGPAGAEAGVPILAVSSSVTHAPTVGPWLVEVLRDNGAHLVPVLIRIIEDRDPPLRHHTLEREGELKSTQAKKSE